MASNIITGIVAGVGAGANATIRPPVGEGWVLHDFASDNAFVAAVPDLQVQMYNGATAGIIILDPTTDPGIRTRQLEIFVTNGVYVLVTNTGAAGANIGYFGEKVNVNNIRSGTVVVAPTAYNVVRPPANETWLITEWGTSVFSAVEINPACEVGLTDGALVASRFVLPTMVRGQDKKRNIVINHDVYLNIYSTPGCAFYYSAIRIPNTCISSITDVVGSATLDVIPPVGDEWVITEIGAETWAGGGAPNDYPDVSLALRVAVNSNLLVGGAGASLRWNSDCILKIDNTHFLRATELSAANNEVCISGYLQRSS